MPTHDAFLVTVGNYNTRRHARRPPRGGIHLGDRGVLDRIIHRAPRLVASRYDSCPF